MASLSDRHKTFIIAEKTAVHDSTIHACFLAAAKLIV